MGCRIRQAGPLSSYVTLGESLNLSVPQLHQSTSTFHVSPKGYQAQMMS